MLKTLIGWHFEVGVKRKLARYDCFFVRLYLLTCIFSFHHNYSLCLQPHKVALNNSIMYFAFFYCNNNYLVSIFTTRMTDVRSKRS